MNTAQTFNSGPVKEDVTTSLYLLLNKDHRVSRSIRAKWFINQLFGTVSDEVGEDTDDLLVTILSAPPPSPLSLVNTNVFFISPSYSIVLVLDMTSTMMQVSNETFSIKLDEATMALETLLQQLTQPISISSDKHHLYPVLCITVLAYTGSSNPKEHIEVLVQGVGLNRENVTEIVQLLKTMVHHIENRKAAQDTHNQSPKSDKESSVVDNCLERMLKAGLLGIQLLPRTAMKGLVILTDGVGGFTTPTSMHSTVNQLRTANINCWVVLCGGGMSPSLSLGSVSDTQALAFLTNACNGCVIDPKNLSLSADSVESSSAINSSQKAILLWSLQTSSWEDRRSEVASPFCECGDDPFVPQHHYTLDRTTINVPLTRLIGCRIREGFFIQSTSVKDMQLDIVLTYPWQPNINLKYAIRAPLPIPASSCPLLVTLSFIAPYPFVRDYQDNPHLLAGPHAAALRRFKQTLKGITNSDLFLMHLLAFSTGPQFYTLPKSVQDGIPLFHLPPNQSKPVPSVNNNDKLAMALCKYWNVVCSIDIGIWPKWLHTDKIVLVLNQDSALPTHLLYPSSSGRYSTLHCRVAALKLFNCLRSWSSIVLMENQSFLKFLPNALHPKYFCTVRVAQMQCCLLVHIGFIEGTPHQLQQQTLSVLNAGIKDLKIQLPSSQSQGVQRSPKKKKKLSNLPQQNCATIIRKQLQKVLINYDLPLGTSGEGWELPTQFEYLNNYRWQWVVPICDPALIFGLLRQRMREGFLITNAQNGIVTLIAQIETKQPSSSLVLPCLIQYVIFPFSPPGVFSCEVWVEPQYQFVETTPPGLEYLKNEKTTDIPYKIHSQDVETLTSVTTFLEYSSFSRSSSFTLPSPMESEDTPFPLSTMWTKVPSLEVQTNLSSLYSMCHITTLTFSAFMEGSSGVPLTLDNCSPLNRILNAKFHELLQQQLSSASIPVREPHKLMERLQSSESLSSFVKLYSKEMPRLLWRCFTISQEESLSLIFTPCFICTIQEDTPSDSFTFPLVVMHTTLPHILGEDPLVGGVMPLPQDKHYNCLFGSMEEVVEMPSFIVGVFKKVKRIHSLAYLHAMQIGISQSTPPSRPDLELGLSICSTAELSVDLTPLLLATCCHWSLKGEEQTTMATVSSLLETLGDQRQHPCTAHFVMPCSSKNPQCSEREEEVGNLLRLFLDKKGFTSIDQGWGYYWHKEEHPSMPENIQGSLGFAVEEEAPVYSLPPSPAANTVSLNVSIGDESEDELTNLEPIFSPSSYSRKRVSAHIDHAPLFIHLSTNVKCDQNRDSDSNRTRRRSLKDAMVPLCLGSLFPSSKPSLYTSLTMALQIQVFTLLEPHDEAEIDESNHMDPMLHIHSCYRMVVTSLKGKVEWLVRDELVFKARELFYNGQTVPPSLLPSITSHVQGSLNKTANCLMRQEPVKFVFGQTKSMVQFIAFLSTMDISSFKIRQAEDNYFYFTPLVTTRFTHSPLPRHKSQQSTMVRSSTPTPTPLAPPVSKNGHRRSLSLTSSPWTSLSNRLPSKSSISSLESPIGETSDSMYDASRSNSPHSVTLSPTTPTSLFEVKFWLVMRVVPNQVEVYLHLRDSQVVSNEERQRHEELCDSVTKAIQNVCHKTNQWYLLKDLQTSLKCSPLLLPESAQDAWVAEHAEGANEVTVGGERFSSCQFECTIKWKEHIKPHWRLKTMKNPQIALSITRSALEAFAVSNRKDVYVLQDVMEDGNEAIFYLKVSESICFGKCYSNDEALVPLEEQVRHLENKEVLDDDSISTYSYQRSSFDIPETPSQMSRQASVFSLTGGTHESVVLELYGISNPSESMTSRLQRLIQSKLDDKALEMMCSTYTRNQRLELSNADIQFLQEYPENPSEVLSILIPEWVSNPHALFFYVLQQFSSVFIKPQYQTKDGEYSRLRVPPPVEKVLDKEDLLSALQQDLLGLYIRPITRGRGMGLISSSLVSPDGEVLPPKPGILPLTVLPHVPSGTDIADIKIIEEFPYKGDCFSIALHIWERGNIGMSELRQKLVSCVRWSLVDTLIETHFLHLPVAYLTEAELEKNLSPGLLRRASHRSANTSDCTHSSFVDVDITNSSSQESCNQISREIEEAVRGPIMMEGDPKSPDWEQREKQRRLEECRETLKQLTHMGQIGSLERGYLNCISSFFLMGGKLGVPELFHQSWIIPNNYLVDSSLSLILSKLSSSLSSYSLTSEITFSVFKRDCNSSDYIYMPHLSSKEARSASEWQLDNVSYVIVGRDLIQWKETRDHIQLCEYSWEKQQQYLPLSSWKHPDEGKVPLTAASKKQTMFVPRQRMVLASLTEGKLKLWMYNIIEDRVREIKSRLSSLENWQQTRSGFLHNLLSQKMGLFHHTGARDISSSAQKAHKYCNTLQRVTTLFENIEPVANVKTSSTRLAVQVDLDHFYQDLELPLPLSLSQAPPLDPVKRHGNQFKDILSHQRETEKQADLLLKVFNTWDSPDRRNKTDPSTPVNAEVIAKLKRTSRLLHYCSSAILLLSKSYINNLPEMEDERMSVDELASWFNCIREKFINDYTSYLQTLNFQPINERPTSRPNRQNTPQHSMKFYKCLQRSWAGGIILIELSFKNQLFHVKLFSLERSRSSNQPPPSHAVSTLFSQECSRIKDYIHTHSYNYDFHIRNIHSIVQGRLKVEGELDLRNLLNEFCACHQIPPNYIRNRLSTGHIAVQVTVPSQSLYTHILGHCSDYGLQTIAVIQTSGDGCGSSLAWDNCLMIDLRPAVIGLTTSPELSHVLKETHDTYNVIVLAIPDVNEGAGPPPTVLPLLIHMLLVNKLELYPRLTVNSPLVSSCRMSVKVEPQESGLRETESKLQDSVRFHRRKLGYGSLGSPSSASQVVFNPTVLSELMEGLKFHFENIIKAAQSHVRRNELWKRVLYGGISPDIPTLSFVEFQELLQLATLSKLEHFDQVLGSLQKQTRRWYRGLIQFLQHRFNENYKIFTNESTSDQYAVIINEGWHDMFLMVISDADTHQQGFYSVYRKPHEGCLPFEERKISANVEAEQLQINEFINFVCCFLWANVVDDTPSLSPKLRQARPPGQAKK